jgi:Sec-independent protein translocase protein TatA
MTGKVPLNDAARQQMASGGEAKEKFPDVKTPGEGAAEQGNIRGKLGDIMRDLGSGMSSLPEQFGKADQSMKSAQNALKDGDARGSAPAQREALENLQKAEDAALEQMAKSLQMMLSMGFMPQGSGGGYGEGFDPLGREEGNGKGTDDIKLPEEKERRRVQQIIEELRNRSNDYQRPKIERDYIDRLLEQFD